MAESGERQGYAVTALYFLRYWRRSGERLFVFFALAFVLLAAQRLGLTFLTAIDSNWLYGTRLLAFLLLLPFRVTGARRAARACRAHAAAARAVNPAAR